MAQATQIVPMWSFPHAQSYFNDYTEVRNDETTYGPTNSSPHFISVFASGEGIDNTFVDVYTANAGKNMFGPREFEKYGQPYSQMLEQLGSGGGNMVMHAMRVMPDDATYANSYLQVYYKADVENKKFKIFWESKNLSDENAPQNDKSFSEHLSDTPETREGFTGRTILGTRVIGRGQYGNNLRWRITTDTDWEKIYEIKMLKIQVLRAQNGLTSVFTGTASAFYTPNTSQSTFINDLFKDNAINGGIPAVVEINEDNYNAMYDDYVAFLKAVAEANPDLVVEIPDITLFDPFFGKTLRALSTDEYIEILPAALTEEEQDALPEDVVYNAADYAPEGANPVSLDAIQGNNYAGGSDGGFASADPNERQALIDECYIKAFSGVYDKRILSALRIPAVALFDANYSYNVKLCLADLARVRNDALLYLDTGIIPSYSDANVKTLIDDYMVFDSVTVMDGAIKIPCISKNLHHYTIRDPETYRKHTVTFVYYLASIFYHHYVAKGLHVPLANINCQLSGHVKDSLAPTIELFEDELREKFTDARFNWCEAVGPNQFRRVCQLIAQTPDSDMIEESNVHTLFQLKRDIETECRERLYDYTDESSRQELADYITAQHRDWIGTKVQDFSILFRQNEWEGSRSIVHGYISVTFRGLMKKVIPEFDINRRTYTTTGEV